MEADMLWVSGDYSNGVEIGAGRRLRPVLSYEAVTVGGLGL